MKPVARICRTKDLQLAEFEKRDLGEDIRKSGCAVVIRRKKPLFIAEVKPCSPFGFKSKLTDVGLLRVALEYGDMLSIHTHKQWGGSYDWLKKVRQTTKKKILAKGIHGDDADIKRALDHGADYVLVVGRIPPKGLIEHCWVEPTEFRQLMDIPKNIRTVWNQRDLLTGGNKPFDFDCVRGVPFSRGRWLCQASGIKTPKDIHPKADAFIVGEHLPEFVKKWKR